MQQLFYNYIFKALIIIFTTLAFLTFPVVASKVQDHQQFEGYQVKFDYEKYPEEREIAYQYFKKNYAHFPDEWPLEKNAIGIDIYDIDNDGEKEILVYLKNSGYCGSRGCSFEILKKTKNSPGKDEYFAFLRTDSKVDSGGIVAHEDIKILSTLNLGVHDLLFSQIAMWRWQGNYYKLVKVMNEN